MRRQGLRSGEWAEPERIFNPEARRKEALTVARVKCDWS